MELTKRQLEAIDVAVARFKAGERYTVISGYAGSGKSTAVKYIVAALPDINPAEDVAYATFTGKASQVLKKKGNPNTSTLHKLLYNYQKINGKVVPTPKSSIPYKVVVVDEISMVPLEMMKVLSNMKVYVLCMGDPGQLPPIMSNDDHHLLDNPHVFLDEIMRQAAESEIIQLTMQIREGKPLKPFKGKEVMVVKKDDLDPGMFTWADQIICATNETRQKINKQTRALLGLEGSPKDGDKVICNVNYWDMLGEDDSPLVNGSIGYLSNPSESFRMMPPKLANYMTNRTIQTINSNFISDSDELYRGLEMSRPLLEGQPDPLSPAAYNQCMSRTKKEPPIKTPLNFSYGYAVTAHKAQGSEWDNVLVIEEGFPHSRKEHAHWLYTAATRARSRLVIVLKD